MLAGAAELLAERSGTTARNGAFLRLAIRRLGAASGQIHSSSLGGLDFLYHLQTPA